MRSLPTSQTISSPPPPSNRCLPKGPTSVANSPTEFGLPLPTKKPGSRNDLTHHRSYSSTPRSFLGPGARHWPTRKPSHSWRLAHNRQSRSPAVSCNAYGPAPSLLSLQPCPRSRATRRQRSPSCRRSKHRQPSRYSQCLGATITRASRLPT